MMSAAQPKPGAADEEVLGAPIRRAQPALNSWAINVLLVDDDEADSSLVLGVLRRHPNVASAVAIASPEEALAQLATGKLRPNLILLDVQMPRINGFKFVEAMDEILSLRSTPVVMLTTSRFERDVEQARRICVSGYIVKPDSEEDLRKRLNAAIKQAISGDRS